MEFWGVEVKPGQSLKVDPGMEKYIHLSQASLGETKKGSDSVPLYVKFDDQKIVLGTLSAEKFPQIMLDLVFEKEFELSHSSKHASIYFCGYRTQVDMDDEDDDFDESDDESDEEAAAVALEQYTNGMVEKKLKAKASAGKTITPKLDASTAKPKPKAEESKKEVKPKPDDEDDSDDDDDELDLDDDSDDEEMGEGEDDSSSSDEDEDEDDSSDEDEETPVKSKPGVKRSAPAQKTPTQEKKAKLLSPAASQKSGDCCKKGVHTATPHPAKQAGKTDKSKQQSPKSGGSIGCKSCSRTFTSEKSMQEHAKAKHSAAK